MNTELKWTEKKFDRQKKAAKTSFVKLINTEPCSCTAKCAEYVRKTCSVYRNTDRKHSAAIANALYRITKEMKTTTCQEQEMIMHPPRIGEVEKAMQGGDGNPAECTFGTDNKGQNTGNRKRLTKKGDITTQKSGQNFIKPRENSASQANWSTYVGWR